MMPLDNIQYFGAVDTIDPFTGEILPKTLTNSYVIGLPVASNTCRVDIGLIPYGDTWADPSTSVKVKNISTGQVIAELTPNTFGSLPLASAPGSFDAYWVNQDKVNAIVWVNAIYSGAILEITTKCISTAIMGSWMNQAVTYKRNTFNPNVLGYAKGDLIELEPITFDEQTTSASTYPYTVPAAQAYMGKVRTYSAQTTFKQYSLRLRSMKDGNRIDPNTVGAIGSAWAVDSPYAICEEGRNSNGTYTMYAGGRIDELSPDTSVIVSQGGGSVNLGLPVRILVQDEVYVVKVGNNGTNYLFTGYTGINLTNFSVIMIRGFGDLDAVYNGFRVKKIGKWY